jgi:hypothetical protein
MDQSVTAADREVVWRQLRSAISVACGVAECDLHPQTVLGEIGLDSLTLSALVVEVSVQNGQELDFERITELFGSVVLADVVDGLSALMAMERQDGR